MITPVIGLIEHTPIIMIRSVIDHHYCSGGRQRIDKKSHGMPCRSKDIGFVWMVIVSTVGIIMMPFPKMRGTGIRGAVRTPARRAVTDRRTGLMIGRTGFMMGRTRNRTGGPRSGATGLSPDHQGKTHCQDQG